MECLVIKLKESVNDNSLPILGALQLLFNGNADGAMVNLGINGTCRIRSFGGSFSTDGGANFTSDEVFETSSVQHIMLTLGDLDSLIITGTGLERLGFSASSAPVVSFPSGVTDRSVTITGISNMKISQLNQQLAGSGRLLGNITFDIEGVRLINVNDYSTILINASAIPSVFGEITNMLGKGSIPRTLQIYTSSNNYSEDYKLTFNIDAYADIIGTAGVNLSVRGAEASGDLANLAKTTVPINSFSVGALNSSKYISCIDVFTHIENFTTTSGGDIRVLQPMTPEHVDNFLIGLSAATFTGLITLTVKGSRTSASDSAVTTLQGKGVTVVILGL